MPEPEEEDLHPNAPRMSMLVDDDQVEPLALSAAAKGLHVHRNVPTPIVPGQPPMPDAHPGQQWLVVCSGGTTHAAQQ